MRQHDSHARARDLTVGQRVMVRYFRAGPRWIPGTVVKQKVRVRDNHVWKRHVDHVQQMGDTPRELLSLNEPSTEPDITETEFADTSVTDDDFTDEVPDVPTEGSSETTTDPVATNARRYLQRTRRPPDRLIYQDSV